MYYEEISQGSSILSVADAKDWMKISFSKDDSLITSLIKNCIRAGERNTGRDFSTKSWKLLIDEFDTRIHLSKMKVNTITSIKHLVNGSLSTIASTDYYVKNNISNAEILLIDGKSWPTDTDVRDHAIEIVFTTTVSMDIEAIKSGLKKHVSFMYFNRGDFDVEQSGKKSGAYDDYMYDRIQRI